MGIAVLGPLQVDGHANRLSPRDRVVLSALVVNAREPMSTEALADALWGDSLPVSWTKVVYGCVWRLRKILGNGAIDKVPSGYRLTLGDDEIDHRLFERLLERGWEALAGDDPGRAVFLVEEGLGLWRGRALTDVDEWDPGRVEAARLEGLRMDAEELRVEAEVRRGRAQHVLEQARSLVAHAPFRERRWALLATALYQSGRQREALGALQQARSMLVDELGLDPGRDLVELEQKLLRQDPSLTPGERRTASEDCPYRGLLAYDVEDADSFFGREDDIAACLRRLRDSGVLVVIGPSGIGKSSLVCAGVVASLVRSSAPVLVRAPGSHPVDSLSDLKPRGRQTLVVDQAEEAVTLCADAAERDRYFTALATHVGAGGGLVLSLRADHLGDLAPYSAIARILEDGLYLLGPMREPDLRRAIEGPAGRAGLRLEPGLVDLMVRDVEGEPAGLPMLSHVLRETWERREGATMTVSGYKATGGIQHAVSQSAETLYGAMDEPQRARFRSLLLRLVMPTDGEPVRARVSRDKVTVDEAHRWLVEQLVEARLLSIDGETVQIAHEALVRVWPRLRDWLDDDVEGQRLFRHLAVAAEAWDSMGRPDSELYRGARLTRSLEWRRRSVAELNATEAAFLEASAALSEAEVRAADARVARQRRANRRLRGSLVGVGLLLAIALATGLLALRNADLAQDEQARGERVATLAEAGRASAQALNHELLSTALLVHVAALRLDDESPQIWENLASTLGEAGSLQIRVPTGASDMAVSLSANVDGTLLASSSPSDGVQLYDPKTMDPVPFEDDTASSAVRFSPDGHTLAAAVNQWRSDGPARIVRLPVRLFDLPSGRLSDRQLGGWPVGSNVEYSLDFSRDGRFLAAGVNRWDDETNWWRGTGAVMVWDVREPDVPVFEIPERDEAVAALSPDGGHVFTASANPGRLKVYDVSSGRLLHSTRSSGVSDLEVSPDGSTLAVGGGGRVILLDPSNLDARSPALRTHADDVAVEYSHDGSMLLSSTAGGATLWDAQTGAELRQLKGRGEPVWGVAFAPDDRTVYLASFFEGQMMTWDLTGSGLLSVGKATRTAEGLDVSLAAPDGATIARRAAQRLWFVDTRTGEETTRSSTGGTVWFHSWSPDGRWFLTVGPGVLTLWDPETGQLVGEHRYDDGAGVVATFSSDSRRIHVYNLRGELETLDRATLQPVVDPISVDAKVLVPHPSDGTVFGLRADGSIFRADPDEGRVIAAGPAGQLSPGSYDTGDSLGAVSPDGSLMAARHPTGVVRLLDTETLEWVGEEQPVGWDGDISYAPDGSQFASVVAGWIRLWDGRTGAYQAGIPLPGGGGEATVAYLPDGGSLLVSASDGRTWTVDTRLATWVELACQIAGRNLTQNEWKQFFPDRLYDVTCSQWPAGT